MMAIQNTQSTLQEHYDNERFFFDQQTTRMFADMLQPFERPCVVCAPTVGIELEDRGADVMTLDIDERFQSRRSYRRWDLRRPEPIRRRFGVIFCDAPFYRVSLNRMVSALRLLAHFDFTQPLMITYLARRQDALLAAFATLRLRPTEIDVSYNTVTKCGKNDIRVFTNFNLRRNTP